MKRIFFSSIFFIAFNFISFAQDAKFTISINVDSVLLGNHFEVKFTLENTSGSNFQAPSFEGFNVVGGPNQASSFSMMNGATTQSVTYSYYLEPVDIGNFYIDPANVETEEGILETAPLEVIVLPNPDGIKQTPKRERRHFDFFDFSYPKGQEEKKQKPKKKRKIYRI